MEEAQIIKEQSQEELQKLDSEISEQFFKEYKALCVKYKRDFYTEPPKPPMIVKVDFPDNANIS